MTLSGWGFLWLLNEASAVWSLTLEPRTASDWTAKSLPEQPHKPHCHSRCQKPQQSQDSVNIPSHISCFCLVPLAWTTENGVTPGAQLNQALQRKLFTVDQKGQSQIPDEKPHRGLLNRDTTCGLESTTGKTQKDFTGKGQHVCPDVCYLLERETVHSLPVWTCVLLQDQRDNTNSLLSAHKNLCKGMTQLGLSPFS